MWRPSFCLDSAVHNLAALAKLLFELIVIPGKSRHLDEETFMDTLNEICKRLREEIKTIFQIDLLGSFQPL